MKEEVIHSSALHVCPDIIFNHFLVLFHVFVVDDFVLEAFFPLQKKSLSLCLFLVHAHFGLRQ